MLCILTTLVARIIGREDARAFDFQVETMSDSPGLYYENIGETQLYNTEWKLVTYVNLRQIDDKINEAGKYLNIITQFVSNSKRNAWISAGNFSRAENNKRKNNVTFNKIVKGSLNNIKESESKLMQVKETRQMIKELVRDRENPLRIKRQIKRGKRGVFDFVGRIAHILFGTLDDEDASYYSSQISKLENEQMEFLKISKEQMTIFKTTLRSVNTSLNTMEQNVAILEKGLENLKDFMNNNSKQVSRTFSYFNIMFKLNQYSITINKVLSDIQFECELVLQAIVNAQKGILQPHIITPNKIFKIIKSDKIDKPKDLSLPFPLSLSYGNLLLKIIDFDVYLNNDILCYIIKLPLTDDTVYNTYKVLPLPINMNNTNNKFLFIQPEQKYLLVDKAKRYYVKMSEQVFQKCKEINNYWRICKQSFAIMLTHSHEECEYKMIQPIRKIPDDCSKRIITLNQTLWTKLDNNEWLFATPKEGHSEIVTILCNNQEPQDVIIKGTGKLKLFKRCKCYGLNTFLQSEEVVKSNVTNKDIIPTLNLTYDCCDEDVTFKIDELEMHLPIKHTVTHIDELNVASHKIEEVNKLIDDEQWKLLHTRKTNNLSFLSYVGFTTIIVFGLIVLCCCCKKCNCGPKFNKWWKDCNDDKTSCINICFKPRIVNKCHASDTSLNESGHYKVTASNAASDLEERIEMTPRKPVTRSQSKSNSPNQSRASLVGLGKR